MPRGYFWEMIYDPDGENPSEETDLLNIETVTGYVEKRISSAKGQEEVSVRLKKRDSEKLFEKCDFGAKFTNSEFTNCKFFKCNFQDSEWITVKFSNCVFQNCNFIRTSFKNCVFVDNCIFIRNSASAELLRMENTSINAEKFLSSVTTNLSYLPEENTTEKYQKYRLVQTKEKLAKMIYSSTKDEADVDFYFLSHKQLVLSSLRQRIEQNKYKFSSESNKEEHVKWLVYFPKSILARIAYIIAVVSGLLTNWGKSLIRPILFFFLLVIVFSLTYNFFISEEMNYWSLNTLGRSTIRAIDITIVAGYTIHRSPNETDLLTFLSVANLFLGIYWYSLVVSLISKRIMR